VTKTNNFLLDVMQAEKSLSLVPIVPISIHLPLGFSSQPIHLLMQKRDTFSQHFMPKAQTTNRVPQTW